ncbi:hypothetical protein PIB30_087256 [Stylosanthes scabra]|uniref:Uncharacterized protein n=1 Tax=Stylosanthes scabra TaxID=79078 RepID=A0ABU6YUS6_9FABA|nr:hypothetical protein [Stylosanthes scabra]
MRTLRWRRQLQLRLVVRTLLGRRLHRGYEIKIYESWRQRAAKRLQELFHEIRKKGVGWLSFGARKTSRGCIGPTRRTEPPRPVDR